MTLILLGQTQMAVRKAGMIIFCRPPDDIAT